MEYEKILEEIELALNDCFVAVVEREEEAFTLRFLDGKKFRLRVEEVKE
ncbi:MAG: hypothetical protein IJX88_00020 [Clostridia bacterium]|nr:hypothetical protein [Clostridia bacterium]